MRNDALILVMCFMIPLGRDSRLQDFTSAATKIRSVEDE